MSAPLLAHRRDIQGLRGLAVLLVVVFHTGLPVPGGFTGVDVFFVISGFVISRMLWRELHDRYRIDVFRFYARRARRLLPALALMLSVVAIGSLILESPSGAQQLTASTGAAAAFFVANAAEFLTAGGRPLLHTWSLAVEEQFYLLFPCLLLLTWRLRHANNPLIRRVAISATVGLVLLLSLLVCLFLSSVWAAPFDDVLTNHRLAFFGSPTRAWEFAVGSLLAIGEVRLAGLRPAFGLAAGCVGLLLVLTGGFALDPSTAFPGPAALLPVGGTALLIIAGTVTSVGVPRAFTTPVLTWIGDRSYGWYLWHWPFIVFAQVLWPGITTVWLVGVALAALIPTALSYRYLENPIRLSPTMVRHRVLGLAAACVLIPTLLFAGLYGSTLFPSGVFGAAGLVRITVGQ